MSSIYPFRVELADIDNESGKTVILNGNFQKYIEEKFKNLNDKLDGVASDTGKIDRKLDQFDVRVTVLEHDKLARDTADRLKRDQAQTNYINSRKDYLKLTAALSVVVILINVAFHFWQ